MNPTLKFPGSNGDDAVEARIVAWVLGECSALESADLERLCEDRPELFAFRCRMNILHQSLIPFETTPEEPAWKLPLAKRKKLDAIFKEESRARTSWTKMAVQFRPSSRTLIALAACLVFAAVVISITSQALFNRSPLIASHKKGESMQNFDAGVPRSVTRSSSSSVRKAGQIYEIDSVAMSQSRELGLHETTRQRQLAVKRPFDTLEEIVAIVPPITLDLIAASSRPSGELQEAGSLFEAFMRPETGLGVGWANTEIQSLALASPHSAPSWRMNSAAAVNSGARSEFRVARNGNPRPERHSRRAGAALADGLAIDGVASTAPAISGSGPAIHQPSVKLLAEIPRSKDRNATFPFNTSEVSFQLAKAAIAQGISPDPSTIQLEQFYNAVDYGDPVPAIGESVAATIEQSSHPFLTGTHLVRVALRIGSDDSNSAQQVSGIRPLRAEDLKVTVKFNPQRIGKYRLLGFEQKRPETEQFSDESVNAAQSTNDDTGVAIYQVESQPEGSGEVGELSISFHDPATGRTAERIWTIFHQSQPTDFDRAAPSMQLAGLSLFAAEKLCGGPTAKNINFNQLSASITRVKQFYGSNSRACEMLNMIEKLK